MSNRVKNLWNGASRRRVEISRVKQTPQELKSDNQGKTIMKHSSKLILSALLLTAGAVAAPASAAPLSSSLTLKNVQTATVDHVQWRHRHYGRRAYRAYGFVPGYRYGRRHRYHGSTNGSYRGCTGDQGTDSAYPSWACQ
jgi:hypothetical protein